jgi:hypothetical protein
MSMPRHHSVDPEAPEADVLEQEQDVSPDDSENDEPGTSPSTRLSRDPEVPEADALEQSIDVPYDDDYEG